MTYIGEDPSFTAFGLTIIDTELKTIQLFEKSVPVDKHKIVHNWKCITDMTNIIKRLIRTNSGERVIIGQEVPSTYTGWFIGELFALGYSLSEMVHKLNEPYVQAHNCYTPAIITTIHGKKGTTKYDTIHLVMDTLIPILRGHGYSISVEKTTSYRTNDKDPNYKNRYIYRDDCITDGEADSFIYAIKQLIKYEPNSHLAQDLLAHCPNLDKGKVLE